MEQVDRGLYVYDIETLASCFTYSAINIDTGEKKQFVIHKERDESERLRQHLNKECKGQIGFNNVSFDYPVLHLICKNYNEIAHINTDLLIKRLYAEAQRIIVKQNSDDKFSGTLKEKYFIIPQLDCFKIWHYDNRARMTSLKALEISMNFPNVMEMPIEHTNENITLAQVDEILEYNMNDVLATYEFYKKTVQYGKIELRKQIINKYGLQCLNWNNGKIGENLILKLYCDKTGKDFWETKKLRSPRESIALGDCIPNNIMFTSGPFNKLLDYYESKIITETKGSVDYSLIYKGLKYYYGTGGIHAAIKSGIYESNSKRIIKTADVVSLYPNIPIVYDFYIEHLGLEFLNVYKNDIVGVRLAEKAKPKDQQDKAIVDGFKEAANIPYGKSNDVNSPLYDPLYSMKTTIGGQLAISMLCEQLAEIPDSQILMVNTDGLEIDIPREYEDLYYEICKNWEKTTKLILEFDDYQKMWIGDINNYGCISVKGKVKNKGRFEVDKVIGNEPAYHKDNSFRIIPLAIQEFFVNDTPVEKTIMNHFNNTYSQNINYGIYDFCGRQKFKGEDYGETHKLNYSSSTNDSFIIEKQQKNTRYYISKSGASFIKVYAKGSVEVINKGYQVIIFNKYFESDNYNIDYSFYIKEANKEVDNIIDKQLSLF